MSVSTFRLDVLVRVSILITLVACGDKPSFSDTDKELFRSPEQLTTAREMNVAKWTSDYFRKTGRLPQDMQSIRPTAAPEKDAKDDVLNDVWGRPFAVVAVDSGFVVRSAGPDGQQSTPDDITYKVNHSAREQ